MVGDLPVSDRVRISIRWFMNFLLSGHVLHYSGTTLEYTPKIMGTSIMDISSGNVLLDQLSGGKWRAKVTDYGSVNIIFHLNTQNPGSPVYSAPEASNPSLQSPNMDIFSFEPLVLEMLTGRLPAPDDRIGMLGQVHHEQLLDLIERCLTDGPEDRPSTSAIISEL